MRTKLLLCDAPDGVAMLEYGLLRSPRDFEIEVATDGYRGIELAARTHPDVIVVEVALPGLSGAELVRRLRTAEPAAKVLAWSSLSSPEGAAEILRAGAVGYLLKEDGGAAVTDAIPTILEGGAVISPKIAILLLNRFADGVHRERELNRALADASMKLEQVTHTKAEFLANVSHELRTPVTVVKGIAYVLAQGAISEEEKAEFLERLQGAVDKLTGLVDNVLTIADLERGHVALQIGECDLATLVSHVCDEVSRKYPEVPVEKSLPGTAVVQGDSARLSEATRQLIDNACRYSPTGAPVGVKMRFMDEGVTVSVTDTGEGLRREVVAMAFNEPFTAGEQILRKERSGIGLGIHLARQLVLMHGGIMWADPLPGGGTRVSFCVPSDQQRPISDPRVVGVGREADGPGDEAMSPAVRVVAPSEPIGTGAPVHPDARPSVGSPAQVDPVPRVETASS